ncbi:MAG TPA: type I methionyl aminopeptidase [Planctomycetota bacterium]|nr:type I methionyl aminopeptidase [Planctomycetota bacterium]
MIERGREPPIIKTEREIEKMRVSGRMVAEVLAVLKALVKPGTTTGDLNEAAYAKMKELGGEPSFLNYTAGSKEPYPAVVCISIDEEIVHGIPGRCHYRGTVTKDRTLQEGELVSVDCGVKYDGFHGDSAVTFAVGKVSPEKQKLMDVCRESLWAGIRAVKPNAKLSEVAAAIEGSIRQHQEPYGIVEEYVGHGIGRHLHEPPQVPNFAKGVKTEYILKKGYVIAIEPMVNMGTRKTQELSDGWTVITRDRKPSAHFEHTIAVTEAGHEVLTLRADGSATH